MITVITSNLNSGSALRKTAESILLQRANFQWIIADGGSTDESYEFLQTLVDQRVFWFSGSDSGIYEAWNKACCYIAGDWVIFMGAGDVFVSDGTLEQISKHLHGLPDFVDYLYGNVSQKHHNSLLYRYGEVDTSGWQYGRRAIPVHQGIFHKASLLKQPRPFDQSYRLAGDTKFLLSTLKPENTVYVPLEVAHMDPFGISSSRGNALLLMREYQRLGRELGCKPPLSNRFNFTLRCYLKYLLHYLGFPATWSIERGMRAMGLRD